MAGTSSTHRQKLLSKLFWLENYIGRYREKNNIKIAPEMNQLLKCELQGTCLVYHHFLLCPSDSIPQSENQDNFHNAYIHSYISRGSKIRRPMPSSLLQCEPAFTCTPTAQLSWNPNSRDGSFLKISTAILSTARFEIKILCSSPILFIGLIWFAEWTAIILLSSFKQFVLDNGEHFLWVWEMKLNNYVI